MIFDMVCEFLINSTMGMNIVIFLKFHHTFWLELGRALFLMSHCIIILCLSKSSILLYDNKWNCEKTGTIIINQKSVKKLV